ncbi:MAG: hypothetical protein ABSB50_15420 [Terracidiphilus sp.]
MKIGIVGYGSVGKALADLFCSAADHELATYDKFLPDYATEYCRANINKCALVFVCVPTPSLADGSAADVSAVEDVVGWIRPPICIKSTVIPGTTERLIERTRKSIVVSPEYMGESKGHPWGSPASCGFLIVGGQVETSELVFEAYRACLGPTFTCFHTDERTAELCKYMENAFLGMKVAFVNQFYDISMALNVDWPDLRKLWLLDNRVGTSHTHVTADRGFGGRCLPKDMRALVAFMKDKGGAPLLEALLAYNEMVRRPTSRAS